MKESVGFFHTQIPWLLITRHHEGVVLQKDGILQRTFAYRAPDIDSSDAFGVNQLSLRVNDVIKRLGSGWAFFFEAARFLSTEYPAIENTSSLCTAVIDAERQEAFANSGEHFETSYYLTFVYRPPSENVKKLTRIFIHSESNESVLRETVREFVKITDDIVSLLSGDIIISPLDNESTVAYLHSSVSLKRHYIKFPHTAIMLDHILPDEELETSLTMKLGDNYIPIIGVRDFPHETYPAILDELNRARLEYRWVSRLICLDKEEALKEAERKEKTHRGNRKSLLQTIAENTSGEHSGRENAGAGVKEQDAIAANVEIETDEASLGFLTTGIMVWDTNLKIAKKKASLVTSIINGAGFTAKEETINAFEAFKAMMPGQIYANFRAMLVMSYSVSHTVPLSSVWAGQRYNEFIKNKTGCDIPLITCSTNEGTPFYLSLNVGDVGHTFIAGPTGAGKSTLLNLLETQILKYPASRAIVFDKGKSCRAPCLASDGIFYEPAAEGGLPFQPLRRLESDSDITHAMDFIESLIITSNCGLKSGNITPAMRSAIKESLELLREKPPNSRTLTSFIQYANYLDPDSNKPVLKEYLQDYLIDGGKFGKIFDAVSPDMDFDARFLAIEMEHLINRGGGLKSEGCVAPALVYLFNMIENLFDGRLTLLVLDEAWLFLKNPVFADKILDWLKTLRKKNVFVVFATQDVADVYNSPLRTTIMQQCFTKIYLADPSALTPALYEVYEAFGLSGAEINVIASSRMKRDYFYTSTLGRRLFQLNLGRVTLDLIGAPDHALIDKVLHKTRGGHNAGAFCRAYLDAKNSPHKEFAMADMPQGEAEAAAEKPENIINKENTAVSSNGLTGNIDANNNDAVTSNEVSSNVLINADVSPADADLQSDSPNNIAAFFAELQSLNSRKKKDGQGRSASLIAARFGLSTAIVYKAKFILKYKDAFPDVFNNTLSSNIFISTAYKQIKALLKEKAAQAQETAITQETAAQDAAA